MCVKKSMKKKMMKLLGCLPPWHWFFKETNDRICPEIISTITKDKLGLYEKRIKAKIISCDYI